jgi:serine/threonine-protein kinase RsbW
MSEGSLCDHSFLLRLTAGPKDLAQIRRFVQESSEAFGLAPGDVPDVLLAVDEAVTNIIVHGYAGRGGPVEIEITRSPGALVIRLRDEARPFDPTGVAAPDLTAPLEERAPGRLGTYLIRQVMSELIYRRQPGGRNELTMMKRVP